MGINFNINKWLPRIVILLAVVAVIWVQIYHSTEFQTYGLLINILTTIAFIWLTYETLLAAVEGKQLPYVDVHFIIASKVDEIFKEKYPQLKETEKVKKIIEDSQKSDNNTNNYVFARIENIGEATGIEVKLDIRYQKKSLGEISEGQKLFEFGTLRSGDNIVELVEFFEFPVEEDYIKINECRAEYNNVKDKHSANSPKKQDFAKNVSSVNNDTGAKINLKNKSN